MPTRGSGPRMVACVVYVLHDAFVASWGFLCAIASLGMSAAPAAACEQ